MAYNICVRANLTGQRFGRLAVLQEAGARHGNRYWRCECDCGGETTVRTKSLRNGDTNSCGCLWLEIIKASNATHRLTETPEYRAWRAAKDRCYNPNTWNFHNYGGRGISMCDRWRNSFEAFYADMGPRPSAQHSIDRINNDGNYEPDNCRWSTRKEQRANRRDNHAACFLP
jgi:hypothetical protein